ncbi:hypothetical protein [Stutzerimonas stutzeri]|uniref:hypothetical protein n=1 Tax=Stutzerimonas stutzeri TaxID=316 RepID=UPI0015E461AE|nr:hypothetical protein [Stutzerimonas stutzeri]MBA1280252.1 hypothetical protein [Stutzerimonas stutzeri]
MNTMKTQNYGYYVNLDERGVFNADVRNMDGASLIEVASDEDGEVWQIEAGYMRDTQDISGLAEYAVSMGQLPAGARIHTMSDFETLEEEWNEALSVVEQFDSKAKIADFYDDNEELADALNRVIDDFEYPDHSHKTVASLLAEIQGRPAPEVKKSSGMRMG